MKMVIAKLSLICYCFISITLVFSGRSSAAIDPNTIVGIWLFDGGEGDIVSDDSGNGHDGNISGDVNWTKDGKFSSALSFPGEKDSFVNIPHDDALSLNAFTITTWINTETPPATGEGSIVTKAPASLPRNYNLRIGGDSTACIVFSVNNGWAGFCGKTPVTNKTWRHVAATHDDKTGLQIYIDGKLDNQTGFTGEPDANDAPLMFGAMKIGSGHPYTGILDDVGIFNVALIEADVKDIMTRGLGVATGILLVSPLEKLATVWGAIKAQS